MNYRLILMVVAVAVVATAPSVLADPSDVYVNWNVYDNTAADGFYYYSYAIFAVDTMDQTLSKWFLDIGGAPDWEEVISSPAPTGTLPAVPSDNSTGYTMGYTWEPAVAVDLLPGDNPTGLGHSLLWETTTMWGRDADGDGVPEVYEPGIDTGYLAGYAGIGPPTDPSTVANTDVAIGWFQFRSTGPPAPTAYRIDNGHAEWFGEVEGPTPEPISLLLLLAGAPAVAIARRRRRD
ncbi:MAG: PEP-CTERM sorting domain-containing protein [candidate division WS1 bacterium]|nr:PEP-CTERM sorting domain-containing protein [candidate division WS1 bacterium]